MTTGGQKGCITKYNIDRAINIDRLSEFWGKAPFSSHWLTAFWLRRCGVRHALYFHGISCRRFECVFAYTMTSGGQPRENSVVLIQWSGRDSNFDSISDARSCRRLLQLRYTPYSQQMSVLGGIYTSDAERSVVGVKSTLSIERCRWSILIAFHASLRPKYKYPFRCTNSVSLCCRQGEGEVYFRNNDEKIPRSPEYAMHSISARYLKHNA